MPEQPAPVPQHHPSPRELDDLELLLGGGLAPLTGFDTGYGEPRSPVTLDLPEALRAAPVVELVDPEGLPLARLEPATGAVHPLSAAAHGPFRDLHLTPAQVHAAHAGRTVVPVVDALGAAQLDTLRGLGPVVLLALVGTGTPALSPVALLRATRAAAAHLGGPERAAVVAVPLASRGDAEVDHALGVQVVRAYAGDAGVHALPAASDDDLPDDLPDDIAAIVEADQPPPGEQGLVLFLTGLSGSGKSTLARALTDLLLEQGTRTVTSLDGDVVRRTLSAGLGFSQADRETNIRRIGWVAAEIARHGGVAVVSPIAPYDATRQQVRAMVEDAGGAFFLVHVATPLEECERRDRKGLYAKARAGEIPEFTGISSPYEEPADADVRVDTTGRTVADALGDVLDELRAQGHLDLAAAGTATPPPTGQAAPDRAPLRVLFVCTANICRSPAMELLARDLAPALVVSSAGTHGHVDAPVDAVVAGALPAGVDHSGFRARRLTPALLREADVVLTAESAHRSLVLEEQPGAVRKVFTLGQLAAAVEQAPPGLSGRALLSHVAGRRTPPDPADDVADPYQRGADAAREAVEQVERLLRVVLPRLQGGATQMSHDVR